MADIHQAIRVMLAKKNKSQSALARELGLSKFHINHMCHGRRTPSWGCICDMSEAFEMKVSDFIKEGEE